MKILCKVQLSEHRYKTPEGYLVCQDCIIARTGKQTYLKSELWGISEGEDEYIDVDRKPEQVFDERTLASFEGKPLTIDHPDVSVSPENYKELAVGNVHNVRRGMFGGSEVILADITVYDAHAIDLIESKEMEELSCGYDCDITDGPNPEQINIRGNHVALCEQGRAGIARIQDSVEGGEVKDNWGAKPVVRDSVQKGTLIQEFGRYADQYKVIKIQGNVLYCEEINTGKTILFKKDKENVDWAVITKSEIQDSASECGKTPKAKDADPEKKYMVYHFSFANQRNTLDADNLSLEEANRIFDQAIDHFSRFNKSVYHTSGFSVTLQEESDFFGDRDPVRYAEIDENGEIKETSNLRKDSPALACEPFEGVYKGYDYHYGKEDPDNVRIFKKGEFIKNMPIDKCLETGDAEKEVKRELFAMDEYEWWSKTHPGGHMDFWEDSILPAFIISLGDDYYLDEYDRPTKDIAKARRFDTREKADEYRKIYCKGEVKEIDDHVIDSAIESEDILKVKKLIEGITYDKISSDKELKVIDILFPDRINQRKAARKLNKLYDLEMSEEEGANAYWVTLYEAYDKDPDAPSMEDSEPVEGEEYSKRFYVKAIKALESKKSKLEKNELIDVNQEDYEEQKEKMISEIDKQIAEYKGKLNAE